jgi:hypothetical protein
MKFYTLPLLLLYLLVERRKWLKLLALAALLILTPIILDDILSAPGFGNPLFVAFGLLAPGLWVNFFAWRFGLPIELGPVVLYVIGGVVFISLFFVIYFSSLSKKLHASQLGHFVGGNWQRNGFLFSASAYIACFLAGMNYDYRLVFLIFAILLLNASYPELRGSRWFVSTQISALWATYFFFGATGPIPVLLAILGNFCQLVLALYLIGAVFRTLQVSYGLFELQASVKQWVLRKAH